MTMVLILASVAVLVAVACVVLGTAAARRADSRPDPLDWLMNLRSPSGSRFFPTDEAARDFVQDLDGISDPDHDRQPNA
jgi:hypothetical protein